MKQSISAEDDYGIELVHVERLNDLLSMSAIFRDCRDGMQRGQRFVRFSECKLNMS